MKADEHMTSKEFNKLKAGDLIEADYTDYQRKEYHLELGDIRYYGIITQVEKYEIRYGDEKGKIGNLNVHIRWIKTPPGRPPREGNMDAYSGPFHSGYLSHWIRLVAESVGTLL
jgi:hypothetical protein